MTRKEKMREARDSYINYLLSTGHNYVSKDNMEALFEAGVKWCDANSPTPWISVEEDLPCFHKELLENENYTKKVLVVLAWNEDPTARHIDISDMSNVIGSHNVGFYWRCDGYYTVTHWSRLPELPKE